MSQIARMLISFQAREFRLLWLSTLSSSTGMWIQQVAVGWMVLEMTNSPIDLGVVSAARMAPFLFLGMPAGALADKFDRRNMLIAISILSVAYSIAMALIAITEVARFWHVVLLTFLFGCTRAFESPARQALVYDQVGSQEALRGIALNAMAMRLMGIFGGILGGVLIPFFGVEGSFMLMAFSYGTGIFALASMRTVTTTSRMYNAPFLSSVVTGLRLIRGNQAVLVLVLMSMVAEVFAFSHATLMPVFARDILMVGAVGLGVLTATRALGASAATLILAALNHYNNKLQLLLWAFALYGLSLVLFSMSQSYLLSLLLMMAVGGAAAAFDTLQVTILQLSVPDEERGRAMGYWVASLGSAPIGHLQVGALAAIVGAPLALATNGSVIMAIYVAMVLFAKGSLNKAGIQVSGEKA